ncbi:MAG: hypothetical protein ACM30H_14550 [Clostridia bacterium]
MTVLYPPASLHVRSARLASGDELLIAEVRTEDGRVGYGFSYRLDATEARHMAERHAGLREPDER